MSLPDADQLELLQRRLEERVRSSVETRLFRHYRNIGSVLITALGLVGITVGWPALSGMIERQVKSQIAAQVTQPVEQAREVASEAEALAETSVREVDKGLTLIQDKQDRITETLGRLDLRSEELNGYFARINAQIADLNLNTEDVQSKIDGFNAQLKFNLATQEDIAAIDRDLVALAEQARSLTTALGALNGNVEWTGRSDGAEADYYAEVVGNTKVRSEAAAVTKSTVYVQYSGGRRDDINALNDKLLDSNWLVPAAERSASAAGFREIRFFHEQDAAAADNLAAAVNRALADVGLSGLTVTSQFLRDFPKPPRQGVLELWIDFGSS